MIVTALAVWPTITTRLDASRRCRDLLRRHRNGILKRDCDHNRRRETIRLVKHSLLVFGVAMVVVDPQIALLAPEHRVHIRTAIMALVSWLIGLTSWWDRRYTRRLEADLDGHPDYEDEGAERKIERPPYPTQEGAT